MLAVTIDLVCFSLLNMAGVPRPALLCIHRCACFAVAFAVVVGGGAVFDVTTYGAVGDGITLDTAAVRKATAALALNHGGELRFPGPRKIYLTGA